MKHLTKSLLIVALGLLISFQSDAQTRIGVMASTSFDLSQTSDVMLVSNDNSAFYEIDYVGQQKVRTFGISSRSIFGNLFLNAGIAYRQREQEYLFTDFIIETSSRQSELTQKTTSLHFPISAGYVYKNFSLGVGPTFDYVVSENMPLDDMNDFENRAHKLTPSFQFSLGYTFLDRVHIELKYENALSKALDQYEYQGEDIKLKSSPNLMTLAASVYL